MRYSTTKTKIKRASPEHALQVALKRHLDRHCNPEDAIWFAVPNGGKRHFRTAMMLQAEGLKRGVSDLCFILKSGRFAGLELKAAKGRVKSEQTEFINQVTALGGLCAIAYSFDEALAILTGWGVLRPLKVAA